MTTSAGQISATPILDLLQPLPEHDTERTSIYFAFAILAVLAAVLLAEWQILFGILLIKLLITVIHESGHLVAGWCVGLRFKGVTIDPFTVTLDSGRWKFAVKPSLFSGFAYMCLDRIRRVRLRLIVFVAGGPAASISSGIAALLMAESGLAQNYSAWAAFFGLLSLIVGYISLTPFRSGRFANDGMLLRALLFRKVEATQLVATYAISTVKYSGILPPDYLRRWFRLAATPSGLSARSYYASWLAYETAKDNREAAQFLEQCLAQCGRMDGKQRDRLIAEATVFTAVRRDDVARAEVWFKRIKSLDRLHPVWQARVRIALLCARKQFESANAELDAALSLIAKEPQSAGRQHLETSWRDWGQEIQQRMRAEIA